MSGMPVVRLGWPVGNAWLLPATERGPVLVDTGYHALWGALCLALGRAGVRPADLAAAVLTHRHSDHAGNAAALQGLGVPVFAHRRDAQVLAGRAPRPRLAASPGVGAVMCGIENRFPPAVCDPIPLDDGDSVAGLSVHWMPGHTEGSVFLHHAASGTLFTGDMLLNAAPPLTYRIGLTLPYPAFCEDHGQALASLTAFLEQDLEVRRLCAGHGPLRVGPVQDELCRLLRSAAVRDARGSRCGSRRARGLGRMRRLRRRGRRAPTGDVEEGTGGVWRSAH